MCCLLMIKKKVLGAKMDKSNKIRIMFLGDSITQNGYHISIITTVLNKNLKGKDYEIVNVGVSSENTTNLTEMGHPFPRPQVLDRLERALKFVKPDCVIICYGVNDAIYLPFSEERFEKYKKGMTSVIEQIQSLNIETVICTPTFFDNSSVTSNLLNEEESGVKLGLYEGYDDVMSGYADWIIKQFGKVNIIIDYHQAMKSYIIDKRINSPNYKSGDGVHPNFELNAVMAREVLKNYFNLKWDIAEISEKEFKKGYKLNYKKDQLIHVYAKESIGHGLPNKSKIIPLEKLEKKVEKLNKKIFKV